MIDLPTDLPAELAPLSWLVGVWEGTGVIDYDTDDTHFTGEFHHRVSFSHDGEYLASASETGTIDLAHSYTGSHLDTVTIPRIKTLFR